MKVAKEHEAAAEAAQKASAQKIKDLHAQGEAARK